MGSRSIAVLLAGLGFCGEPVAEEIPAKASLYFGGGSFRPEDDGKLTRRDGLFNAELGFGWRLSRHFAWEINYLYFSQEADAPAVLALGGTGGGRAGLNTDGYGAMLKFVQPAGPFDFFAGAGVGSYDTKMEVTGVNFLTFQSRSVSRSDNAWGQQYVAGIDLRAGAAPNVVLTVQYRRVVLNGDFGAGIGSVSLGGDMWQILLRAGLGECRECRH